MATICREKPVIVAVYVERPGERRRRRLPSSSSHHDHQHWSIYQANKQQSCNGKGGYNRKAELLNYSRHLRDSAALPSSSLSSSSSLPNYQEKQISPGNYPFKTRIIAAARRQPQKARDPTCLPNCKFLVPRFLTCSAAFQSKKEKLEEEERGREITPSKLKAVMKSFQISMKGGFISKLVAAMHKHK